MKYEIKKMLSGKLLIVLMVCVFTNGLICYISAPSVPATKEDIQEYIFLYENEYDNFKKLYTNSNFFQNIDTSLLTSKEYSLITVWNQASYIEQYYKDIDSIIFQANVNLSELDADTYMYRYQMQVRSIYENLLKQELNIHYIKGWDFYLEYTIQTFISAFFIVISSIFLVGIEDNSAMSNISNTYKNGKLHLAINKITAILFTSIVIVLSQSLITVIVIAMKTGFCGYNAPIQLLPSYELMPMLISIGKFTVLQIFIRILGIFLLGILTAIFTKATRTQIVPLLASILILSIEYFLMKTENLQNSAIKLYNLFGLLFRNNIFQRYYSFSIFGYSVDAIIILIFAVFLVSIILSAVLILLYYRLPSYVYKSIKYRGYKNSFFPCIFPFTELKKLKGQKWILFLTVGILLTKCVYMSNLTSITDNTVYHHYMLQFEGEYTTEKHQKIKDIRVDIDTILNKKDEVIAAYKMGIIQEDDYRTFMQKYWDSYVSEREFQKIEKYADYLSTLSTQGKKVAFVYDRGYNILFNESPDLLLCALIFVLTYWIFSYEEEIKITQLTQTMTNGRKIYFSKKVFLIIILSNISVILFSLIDIFYINRSSGFPLINASTISLMQFEKIQSELTILVMLLLCFVIKLFIYSIFSVINSLLGLFFKKITLRIFFWIIIFFIPSILTNFLPVFQFFDILGFLSGSKAIIMSAKISFLGDFGLLLIQIFFICIITTLFINYSQKKWYFE